MRRIEWMVLWLACSVAQAQVEVRLQVRDEAGQLIVGYSRLGGAIHPSKRESDATGQLPYRVSGEAIVVRKEGYESVRLKVGAVGDILVTMKKLGAVPEVRKCGAKAKTLGSSARMGRMRFLQVEGVEATKRSRGNDYSMRFYRLKTQRQGCLCGFG